MTEKYILFSLNKWALLLMIGMILTFGTPGSSSASCLWLQTQLVIYRALQFAVLFYVVAATTVWNVEANVLYAHSGLGFRKSLYAMADFSLLDVVKIRWFWWQMIHFMRFIWSYFIEWMYVFAFAMIFNMLQSGFKMFHKVLSIIWSWLIVLFWGYLSACSETVAKPSSSLITTYTQLPVY